MIQIKGWGDIAAYRKSRSAANPSAEELAWSDVDMLHSINAIRQSDGHIKITVAGLLVFGKSGSIRRLFPALRVDYIRVPGNAWVENPETALVSLDMRGSIITMIDRVIAAIADDLPKTLRIEDKSNQRTEMPVILLGAMVHKMMFPLIAAY